MCFLLISRGHFISTETWEIRPPEASISGPEFSASGPARIPGTESQQPGIFSTATHMFHVPERGPLRTTPASNSECSHFSQLNSFLKTKELLLCSRNPLVLLETGRMLPTKGLQGLGCSFHWHSISAFSLLLSSCLGRCSQWPAPSSPMAEGPGSFSSSSFSYFHFFSYFPLTITTARSGPGFSDFCVT